jgi:hypothetical protein
MSNKPNGDKTAFKIDSAVSQTDVFTFVENASDADLITLAVTDSGISASGRAEAIVKLSQVLFDRNIEHDIIQIPGANSISVGVLTATTPMPSIMYKKIASMMHPA